MASGVPHELIARNGLPLRECAFSAGVRWLPGEAIMISPAEQYRVLERRDGTPVVLVVEPL